MADWGAIGNMLQGVGAGFSGTLPQYLQGKAAEEEAAFLKDERRRQALIQDFTKAYVLGQNGNWDAATRLLENRHENIVKLGGDPRDTMGLLEMARDPNRRQEALSELGGFYQAAVAAGEVELPGGGVEGAKRTDVFKNGAVLQTRSDGSIVLTTPAGGAIGPSDPGWQEAISSATGSGIQYAGEEAAAKAYAQQGAQYQYAAPIAGAQANARAAVEAETAPAIAAATVAATKGAEAQVERGNTARTNAVAFDAYNKAMEGVRGAFSKTDTGPMAGRLPAVTAAQQGAEGARAAAAPVLKQLFRSSGEGVFTDKDQQLLMDMMPDRKDHPEVVQQKLNTIDAIVKAKLNINGPAAQRTGGQLMQDAQGNKAMVYPDGTIEEVR